MTQPLRIGAFLMVLLICSCKKKEEPTPDTPEPVPVNPYPLPDCIDIPPGPSPFGWTDSTSDDNENVNFFMDLPSRPSSYVYCVNGKIFPLNRLYSLEHGSSVRKPLGNRGEYLPHANAAGWLVFNGADLNIYKVKINGDSLTQLTTQGLFSDPKWDGSGTSIFCFQQGSNPSLSLLVKISASGQGLGSFMTSYPNSLISKRVDHYYLLRADNNNLALYLVNKAINTETLVLRSGFMLGASQNDFLHLCIDPKEENLYWSNARGILHHNIPTGKTDTVFKNCESITFLNPCLSQDGEALLFCCRILKPLNSTVLYRSYRSFEYHLSRKEWRELKFFPN